MRGKMLRGQKLSIKIQRLRLPNGKAVETPEQMLEYIEGLFRQRPMSPKDLSVTLNKSTKQAQRYINALVLAGKLTKIEGSHNYKSTFSNANLQTVREQKILLSNSEFDECESIKTWRKKNNAKSLEEIITTMRGLCMGQTIPELKINPDFWIHPETTETVVSEIRKKYGLANSEQLPKHFRHAIRNFLIYAKSIKLIESDADSMGISGAKPKPTTSTLEMSAEQYQQVKELLKNDLQKLCKFVFRYWTFCRPSSMYLVKIDQLFFYDRIIKYVEVGDNKITDKNIVMALQDKYPIKEMRHRAVIVQELHEHKTDTPYTKHIWDGAAVEALERYATERKEKGFVYLFWDNNETQFTFLNYDKIVNTQIGKDNDNFKEIFFQVGFKDGDFGKFNRANYALRHFGAQGWLQMTNYNYGFVAEMGWEDVDTLRLWYGKRTATALQKSLGEIIPFV